MRNSLVDLTSTPYFNKNLNTYARGVIEVINYILQEYSTIAPPIASQVRDTLWNATKYLRGSISTEIPYEVEYSLNIALNDWLKNQTVIATALMDDMAYHFCHVDTWKQIKVLLPDFNYPNFDKLLIQIALPRIYKHKPLYYIPLYHELGHFIDYHFNISEATFLEAPLPVVRDHQQAAYIKSIETNHRKEFFADLFAASYVGDANYKLLEKIAPNVGHSPTHPATSTRVSVAKDFLSNKNNLVIDLFQNTLAKLGLQNLSVKYVTPDLNETYNNLRPYKINSNEEVHGIFGAAWNYFDSAIIKSNDPWKNIEEHDISRIINDLTEKSIRNRVITEKWEYATK